MTDDLGVMVEKGQATTYTEVYGPGSVIPDYTLHYGEGLNIQPTSTTVTQNTLLSALVKPNRGQVDWAACRSGKHTNMRFRWPAPDAGPAWDNKGPILNYDKAAAGIEPAKFGAIPDPTWWGWDTFTPLPQP